MGRRRPSEGDPKWDGGESVGQVVDRVRKQGHGAAEHDDHRLKGGGDPKADQGDFGCPNAFCAGIPQTSNHVMTVAVCEEMTDPVDETLPPVAGVGGVSWMIMIVLISVIMRLVVSVAVHRERR